MTYVYVSAALSVGFILGCLFMRYWLSQLFACAYLRKCEVMTNELEVSIREEKVSQRERDVFEREKQQRIRDVVKGIEIYPSFINKPQRPKPITPPGPVQPEIGGK